MDELNEFIENELLRIKLSEDDWGWLTFEDESRKNTLLEIRAKVKTLGLLPVSKSFAKQYAEFCVMSDREGMPLLELDDFIKHYCC